MHTIFENNSLVEQLCLRNRIRNFLIRLLLRQFVRCDAAGKELHLRLAPPTKL
jgi:hypothetical protein